MFNNEQRFALVNRSDYIDIYIEGQWRPKKDEKKEGTSRGNYK